MIEDTPTTGDMSQMEPEGPVSGKKVTLLRATYYVYFNFQSDETHSWRRSHPNEEDLNQILQQYDKDGSVASTMNWPRGDPSGYVWISRLSAETGSEGNALNRFYNIAQRVAMEADLLMDGPHCNCDWRECLY